MVTKTSIIALPSYTPFPHPLLLRFPSPRPLPPVPYFIAVATTTVDLVSPTNKVQSPPLFSLSIPIQLPYFRLTYFSRPKSLVVSHPILSHIMDFEHAKSSSYIDSLDNSTFSSYMDNGLDYLQYPQSPSFGVSIGRMYFLSRCATLSHSPS